MEGTRVAPRKDRAGLKMAANCWQSSDTDMEIYSTLVYLHHMRIWQFISACSFKTREKDGDRGGGGVDKSKITRNKKKKKKK